MYYIAGDLSVLTSNTMARGDIIATRFTRTVAPPFVVIGAEKLRSFIRPWIGDIVVILLSVIPNVNAGGSARSRLTPVGHSRFSVPVLRFRLSNEYGPPATARIHVRIFWRNEN